MIAMPRIIPAVLRRNRRKNSVRAPRELFLRCRMDISMKQFALLSTSALLAALMVGCNSAPTETKPTTETTTGEKPAETTAARPASPGEGNKQEGETYKIGIVASLNGELKPWGDDSLAGAKLAVIEANKAGGINGKKVELLIEDSASKAEQGKTAADRLISKGAIAIVGEVASGITAQIGNSAFDAGIPVVAIGATRTDITDKGNNIFRVCYTDDFQGPVMAKFAYEELNNRKVAIFTDNKQTYSVGLSESFKKEFIKLGGEIVAEEFYNSGDQQFNGQLTNIKGKNPDSMFLSGYFTEVGLIARQSKDAGLKVSLLGGDGWDSEDLVAGGGEAILGGYFCNHYSSTEARPEVGQFLEMWKAAYNGKAPGTTMGALGYDAVMLTVDAAKRSKSADSKGLITALEETEKFPAISGEITLKGMNGNPPKRALVVEVTKTGQVFRKAYDFFK
jgi:branched-chain amino acid transport system substrate-binding protein